MTREEAVKRIKEIQKLYVFTPTINEALDLAIEALSVADDEVVDFNNMISGGGERIRNLPPVNQKQITGKLESVENATSESEESTMNQPKSKLDCISRQQAIDGLCQNCEAFDCIVNGSYCGHDCTEVEVLRSLPPVTPKEQTDCTDLINWLLEEVLDEENWELNAVANGEIICRKLRKLDLLEVKDGYYVRASVTPEGRTGEWIVYPLKDEGRVELECSECGYALIRAADRRPHFCENCGAKMGGDDE